MGFYISAPQSSLLLCSTGNLLSFLFWGSEALDRATDVCVRGTSTESEGLMEEGYGRRSGGGIFHLNLPDSGHSRNGGFSFVRMLSECCQRKRSPDASFELGENKQVTAQNSRVAQPCSPRWLTFITHRAHTRQTKPPARPAAPPPCTA